MGRIDGEKHPREDEFFSSELRRQHGGAGGGISNKGLYQMAMYAGLVVFTTLGWRILAELGRIRRRLT